MKSSISTALPTDVDKKSEFDEFAYRYEQTMAQACAVSGETPDFYAVKRSEWLKRRLHRCLPFETALDFGCGTGGSLRYLCDILGCKSVIGLDPSIQSLRVAQDRCSGYDVRLMTPGEFTPSGNIPFAFCNGVFHHIPPAERLEALALIHASLTVGGMFAFWENNPWNPAVLYSMSLNEFDRNAQTISPWSAIGLLKASGFHVQFVDFCFFFPQFARKLRVCEPALRWLPVGAQYLVVAQKRANA
jgi:SAM-dependent methyltransferase